MLTLDELYQTRLGAVVAQDQMLSLMSNVSLALLILYLKLQPEEHKIAAKWRPYLQALPSEFHTPLFFSLDELVALKAAQCFCN